MGDYSVYKHTSPSEKVYIGITRQNPKIRWRNGEGYLHKNKLGNYGQPAMANALAKYPNWDEWQHEILFTGLTKEEAEKEEIKLIEEYKSYDENFGYNIEFGGHAVGRKSEETRKRMSEAKKGAKNGMYGKPSHQRTAVVCIETGILYESLHRAATATGAPRTTISKCCKGELETSGKLHWRYATDEDLVMIA